MQYTRLALAFAALFTVVSSQSTSSISYAGISIPACAQSCVKTTAPGCKSFDVGCICGSTAWIAELSCCISKACGPDDQAATIQYAHNLCASYNVNLPSVASCESSVSTGSAASQTSASVLHTMSAGLGVNPYTGPGLGMAAAGLIAAIL